MRNFSDRCITVSFYRLLALTFGITGLLCALTASALHIAAGEAASAIGVLTVPLIGAGAVMRIRAFFGTLNDNWLSAFEMGRRIGLEQERDPQATTRLRPLR